MLRIECKSLDPAKFTSFMASFHDQEQELVHLKRFVTPSWLEDEIQDSVRRAMLNKAPGREGIHYETLKLEVPLLAKMIFEMRNLMGRTAVYPDEWRVVLLSPIYKKGDPCIPINYRPIFILSCIRKVVEAALAERILKIQKIRGRQYGFRKDCQPHGHS